MSPRDYRIFVLLCIAALAAGLVWTSLRDRDPASDPRVAALTQRISALESELETIRTEIDRRLKGQSHQLARLQEAGPAGLRCLVEVQQEIDDLRGFIAFGDAIRRRVTAECKSVLEPRYGG